MTVAFKTFGCRLNRAEALDLEARYAAAGYEVVDLPAEESSRSARGADPTVIVVRGCSVTARAQRDCEREIARLRARFPNAEIRITGCLPLARQSNNQTIEQSNNLPIPTRTSRAYLKVQDGCSGRCAFCIVPQFRGPPVSVPFDDVVARARAFLAAGYRELVVTGCNLALYRSRGHGLPDLLSALAELSLCRTSEQSNNRPPPSHRIRLGSLEPGICDDALLDAFAEHPNICRFIHLSLQSGSDAVLARMNRPYRIETIARFRSAAFARLGPRLSLGADVVAGFPGETEEDHQLTRDFLGGNQAIGQFTNLHVFPYSERPGTPAATMEGALPRAVRLARARDLVELGRAQRAAFAASFTGRTVVVCVERGSDHGWTDEYLPCTFKGPAERRALVEVSVERVAGDRLHGTVRGS